MRPRLPSAAALLPYLRRIDAARTYSNWGPLEHELAQRLARQFGAAAGSVVLANSGTAALMAAILAVAGRATSRKPLAIVPAYTFVASAVAVELCGYRPHFVDVDPRSWMLDPARLLAELKPSLLRRAGLVMPVAPYGRPISQRAWRAFQQKTGVPVVLDAAAGFESVSQAGARTLGTVPVALSFHATKSFGIGEGGCVICSDSRVAHEMERALNFGFHGDRESRSASLNGKLSEYHAAVGLAELDGWRAKRAALHRVTQRYRRHLAKAGLADRFIGAPEVSSNYALFLCRDAAEARRVGKALTQGSIDFRLWYGRGVHRHHYFARSSRDALPFTEDLAPRLLGLPTAPDLSDADIRRVVAALRGATS